MWTMSALSNQPEVQEAPDQGRAKERYRLVAKLHKLVMEGNVTAVIFALKARHAYREGDPPRAAAPTCRLTSTSRPP